MCDAKHHGTVEINAVLRDGKLALKSNEIRVEFTSVNLSEAHSSEKLHLLCSQCHPPTNHPPKKGV